MPKARPVQAIFGEDTYLAEAALERLLSATVGSDRQDSLRVLYGDEAKWEDVLAAARLEPYRPYFVAVSLVMLAIGFWQTYRPVRVDGIACRVRTGRGVRIVLWVAAAITFLSLLGPRLWS